ncbi:primosomal protein N' [Oerskovia flava]|uniref:primosomal protein N' n=1 Tax=Oerskovia flava TaxID=2986422 RepID=UPI00223F1574|nr:primosomal protein N' [Oerskovia sp. JB1-3-2]
MSTDDPHAPAEQPALPGLDDLPRAQPPQRGATGRRTRRPGAVQITTHLPVARVALDLSPHHLDRTFDYLVPENAAADALPGVRVKVRFGAQDVDGYVLSREADSDHDGRLVPLRRVVSAEQVLTPEVIALCRAVADRYAGTLSDVLRLAVPPRHARAETVAPLPAAPEADPEADSGVGGEAGPAAGAEAPDVRTPPPAVPPVPAVPSVPPLPDVAAGAWRDYRGGGAFLARLTAGDGPRAVWTALPGAGAPGVQHWALALAAAVHATLTGGRGALVVLPDARDVDQVAHALELAGLPPWSTRHGGSFVRLSADDGPAARYRAFLAALRGDVRVVIGTRAAAFAPVHDLGLVACWNDGEDTLAEPRSPYPHARDVLALRSEQQGAAYLLGSVSRTVQAQALLVSGWAREVVAPREVVRARAPRVRALTSVELASEGVGATARLPSAAWRAARAALEHGPVLVQVPRAGYLPVVACARCRTPAQCTACHGPLSLPGPGAPPQCTWCGALAGGWTCPECRSSALRSVRVGSERTAEELGRAFPGVPVRVSGANAPGGVLPGVGSRPAVIVATPGAEPVAEGGYVVALLLDAAASTSHVGLAAAQDALHRWLVAASLVRPASDGGQVLLVGDAAPAPTGALVRWDPAGLADRDLTERQELDLPPAVRVAAVTGDRSAVGAVLARVELATPATTLGPVEVPEAPRSRSESLQPPVRALVRVPVRDGQRLARELSASLAVRSARREGGTVRVQLDPQEML